MRTISLTLVMILTVSPVAAHSWYQNLYDPNGRPCCNEQDCRPVEACRVRDGTLGILIDGRCIAIPWQQVVNTPSPDNRAHACWVRILLVPHPIIRCVVLPGEA